MPVHRAMTLRLVVLLLVLCANWCVAGSRNKPHGHAGELQPFDNRHLPYSITAEQLVQLESGQPVIVKERDGKTGRGFVLFDVAAPPSLCMDRIRDLSNYPNMVPKVKSVQVFDEIVHPNGTVQQSAEFNVGMSFFKFQYFLRLTFEPRLYTLTWTLDYRHASDFEDTIGHWQVMPHPSRSGWSRVLYSTEAKLPPWVPEFVVTFLTKTALIEATSWVRKESEDLVKQQQQSSGSPAPSPQLPDLRPCFHTDASGGRYDVSCSFAGNREEL